MDKKRFASFGLRTAGYTVALLILVGAILLFLSITARSSKLNASPTIAAHRVIKIDASFAHNYRSIAELKKDSTLIIRAIILSQKTVVVNHQVWTMSTVSVERILLGSPVVGATVGIKQLGGIASDGTEYVFDFFPLLNIGAHYWFFLAASEEPGVFYPVGACQGVFTIAANNTISSLASMPTDLGVTIQHRAEKSFIQDIQMAQ